MKEVPKQAPVVAAPQAQDATKAPMAAAATTSVPVTHSHTDCQCFYKTLQDAKAAEKAQADAEKGLQEKVAELARTPLSVVSGGPGF